MTKYIDRMPSLAVTPGSEYDKNLDSAYETGFSMGISGTQYGKTVEIFLDGHLCEVWIPRSTSGVTMFFRKGYKEGKALRASAAAS